MYDSETPSSPNLSKTQIQQAIHEALNQLQTASLLAAELEDQVLAAGKTVRQLTQLLENLIQD